MTPEQELLEKYPLTLESIPGLVQIFTENPTDIVPVIEFAIILGIAVAEARVKSSEETPTFYGLDWMLR